MEVEDSNNCISYKTRLQVLFDAGKQKPETIKNKISNFHDVSLRTVQRFVKKLKEDGNCNRKEYDTSNRFFFEEKDTMNIPRALDKQNLLNAKDIAHKTILDCHPNTIKNQFQRQGYSYKTIKKIPFQPLNCQQRRLAFAQAHVHEDWSNVIFVDEASFWAYSKQKMCWQKADQQVSIQVQKYPKKFHIFGGLSSNGTTKLYIFQGTLTGERYKEILQKQLFPSAKQLYPDGSFKLLQDKDPKHESNIVKQYLNRKNCENFKYWPSNSPDLNPIQNIWGLIKKYINKLNVTDEQKLKKEVKRFWNGISIKTCQQLTQSINSRLQNVINQFGNKINY